MAELGLSPRDVEVLDGVIRGLTNRQIAYELGIGEQTVKNHISACFDKLNVTSRGQAAIILDRHRRPHG